MKTLSRVFGRPVFDTSGRSAYDASPRHIKLRQVLITALFGDQKKKSPLAVTYFPTPLPGQYRQR